MTLDELLREAREAGVDRLDAQCLAAHHLGRPRAWVLAHGDEPLEPATAGALRGDLARRAQGYPLAYLLGEREFHGLTLRVTPDTLIPRPDTETLVDWALERLDAWRAGRNDTAPGAQHPRVLDLGTGSGAIALAIKHARRAAEVTAVDISDAALEVARTNGRHLGLEVEWLHGGWFGPVAGRRFDLIVSNPPYIDAGDPHLEALRDEPRCALTPGADGMIAIRHIVQASPMFLQHGGWLLLEHGFEQGQAIRQALQARGFVDADTRRDLAGQPRCSGAAFMKPALARNG